MLRVSRNLNSNSIVLIIVALLFFLRFTLLRYTLSYLGKSVTPISLVLPSMLNILRCSDFHKHFASFFFIKHAGKVDVTYFVVGRLFRWKRKTERHWRARRERSESHGAHRKDDYEITRSVLSV